MSYLTWQGLHGEHEITVWARRTRSGEGPLDARMLILISIFQRFLNLCSYRNASQ
jgi:hypothetical protein